MPQLFNFPTAVQATPNSCWACAGRMINNWYQSLGESGKNPTYDSDQEFAAAWAKASGDKSHADITIQQSAAASLEDLGFVNNTDDHALPTQQEITDTIANNQPLLAITGDAPPNPNPNPNYQNGHWIVIIGISDDQQNITVFDPDDGLTHVASYNVNTYQGLSYWQNTSYVDSQ